MSGVYELLTKGTVTGSHTDHPATRRGATDVPDFTSHGLVFESSYMLAGGRYHLILTLSLCRRRPHAPFPTNSALLACRGMQHISRFNFKGQGTQPSHLASALVPVARIRRARGSWLKNCFTALVAAVYALRRDPPVTNATSDFMGCLDYIFLQGSFRVIEPVPAPAASWGCSYSLLQERVYQCCPPHQVIARNC